ncbi:MAG: T9SS type A sorting domain-containing protein [Bacteroidales bacterium]|jgi:hypothetical protein|nr:T9SS type A sorting domain-containing protein [Bacteroidales bacterium]
MKKFIILSLFIFPVIVHAQYDGVVGAEGCKAIHCKDARIRAWATSCSIERGYQDIAKPENGFVDYGTDTSAIGEVKDSIATDVISLGDGGVAILSFDIPITNGEGYDFVVFENSLNDMFLELAFVEVSTDGLHYVRFPSTSNTQINQQVGSFGSIEATHINNLAGKYRVGWGTPFDLQELADAAAIDINAINYVKIVDVVGSIDSIYASYDSKGNVVNDPYPTAFSSGGFDLAGVGVLNQVANVDSYDELVCKVFPNPCTDGITIVSEAHSIILYNAMGQVISKVEPKQTSTYLDMQTLTKGIYVLCLEINKKRKFIKIIKKS